MSNVHVQRDLREPLETKSPFPIPLEHKAYCSLQVKGHWGQSFGSSEEIHWEVNGGKQYNIGLPQGSLST